MTLLDRLALENREREHLAPWAARSVDSRGREHPQAPHPLRTEYQRDRDRILHAAAFRRLEYKTQVFIPHERDHNRTRLTHTLEVAQISRTIARALRLNDDLAEAIALAHDLGHTPFGHAGELTLDRILSSQGGFNHNRQSLRIVELLERRYPAYRGLNLTYEVREGLAKHESKGLRIPSRFNPAERPSIEAALVDLADEIAYNAHDIDDGLSSGLISLADVQASDFMALFRGARESVASSQEPDYQRHGLVRTLVDSMVTDALRETDRRISALAPASPADVRSSPEKLAGFSSGMLTAVGALKLFLKEHLYSHAHLVSMSERANDLITALFEELMRDPAHLPPHFREQLGAESSETVIADYIAGMTDRFAEKSYTRLTGKSLPQAG